MPRPLPATRPALFPAIRRLFHAALILGFAAVLAASMPATSGLIFRSLEIYPPIDSSRLSMLASEPATAIVILAAGRRNYAPEFAPPGHQTVDALTLERLRYGAYLARRTHIPVLVSGGLGPPSLAELMAATLQTDYGITPKWREGESRNTAENAIFSSAILRRSGVRHVILVTHAWHMKRAVAAFAANGLDITPAPTAFYRPDVGGLWSAIIPGLGTLRMSGYAAHEIVGLVWYKLKYGY